MAKRPNQNEGNPFDEDEATQAVASPLSEAAAPPGPDRTRIQASPFAAEAAPERKRRAPRSLSSVKVEQHPGIRSRPSKPQTEAAPEPEVIEDWEAPAGEADESTRVGLPPPVRPGRRADPVEEAWGPAADPEEENATRVGLPPPVRQRRADPVEEAWGPAPDPEEGNATRIAPLSPRERPGRDAPDRDAPADENATQAGPPITVEVVEGPDKGIRRPLRGGRMVIGRGEDCDFHLKDAAASRRHVELVVAPTGLVVRDLGSGNGTRVNGEKVTEALVNHGDRIALGRTVLLVVDDLKKFEEERAALARPSPPPPRRVSKDSAPPPRRLEEPPGAGTARVELPAHLHGGGLAGRWRSLSRPLQLGVLGGGGLVLLLLMLAVGKSVAPPAPPPGPSVQEIKYDELFEEGKKFLRTGQPEEALARFEEAQAIFDKAELSRYIESCQRETKAVRLVAQAKAAAAAGEFESAIETLKTVDNLSTTYDEAKKLSEEYERQRVEKVKADINQLIEDDDLKAARALLEKLPFDDAVKTGQAIEAAEKQYAANAADRARRARERAANEKKAAQRRARAEVDQALAGVVRKINSGNFEGAQSELDRVAEATTSKHVIAKVRELRKIIPKFSAAYLEGTSKFNGGAYEQAAKPLLRALSLYEDMDLEGNLGTSLQSKVGKAMEMAGKAAMARQEYGAAARSFREALRFNPGATQVKSALDDISRKAKDVYLEGYVEMERNPDLARNRFRQVLDMVGPENEVHKDAKRRLAELDQK